MSNLIVGCGISGITLANLLASNLKEKVIIIDKRDHIGGNCYDYEIENIYVHKYGAHIFHTNDKKIWNYLSQFTKWYPYMHKVLGYVDGKHIPIPFNLNSIRECFSPKISDNIINKLIEHYKFGANITLETLKKTKDEDLLFLYNYIYNKIFKNYTEKQWNKPIDELSIEIINRIPIRINYDDRYFTDIYQGIPLNGYTNMFKQMLDNDLIEVKLKTSFTDFMKSETINNFKRVFYSGPVDEFYEYSFGKLEYRSLIFDTQLLNKKKFQSNSVINYPNNYDWTRIIEHKYFLNTNSEYTLITYEYPQKKDINNEPYYPVLNDSNIELYKKYTKINQNNEIYFIGRLGQFKYYNMDDAIKNVFKLFDDISQKFNHD